MIVLGLGSNVGDRLAHLRTALQKLKQLPGLTLLQVSPVYQSDALLPENAPEDWNHPYLNIAIRAKTSLTPDALLPELKKIEWSIGRKPEVRHWGPRVMDIDILAFDDQVIHTDALTVPHASLFERPFALWPLADVWPDWVCPLPGAHQGKTAAELVHPFGSRYEANAPFHTYQLAQRIDAPAIVGILNITPDSFSDGGLFLNADSAINQAAQLVLEGAEVIDIGAESTAPGRSLLNEAEEWERLAPVLTALMEEKNQWFLAPKISVDTRHARTAERALALGVDWVNDQSALADPAMLSLLAKTQNDIVVMHHLSLPASPEHLLPPHENAVAVVNEWAEAKISFLEKHGIDKKRIILDPGIGFGKHPHQSLALIQHAELLKPLGTRLLIGHSRKSFMNTLSPYPANQRDLETAAMAPLLSAKGVDFLRVHQADATARFLRITAALSPSRLRPSQTTQK
jgi:2-amino-4-hydroxy-6-hydroxymethyldihydropteridine diphosphokinase/dihydropteroate synthase